MSVLKVDTPMFRQPGMKLREIIASCACLAVLGAGCSGSSAGDGGTTQSSEAPAARTVGTVDSGAADPLGSDPVSEADPALEPIDDGLLGIVDPLIDVCASAAFDEDAPLGLTTREELRSVAAGESVEVQNLIEDCLASE